MRRSSQFNLPMLLITIAFGFVTWLVSTWLYDAVVDTIPRPITIGLMFALLSLAAALVVFLSSGAMGTFEKNIVTRGGPGSALAIILLASVLIGLLGGLFQWIYGLHFNPQKSTPTSYVFVIDDSGSMEGNDPNQLRYGAVGEVLGNKASDFPYMVYGFADKVTLLREMAPASGGAAGLTGQSSGGTSIKGALEQVITDYENGIWDGGDSPKVVLLTDGYATDLGWFSSISGTLKKYSHNRISISTVGLGNVDTGLMQRIASSTGGVFIDIHDASSLAEAMNNAANQFSMDDLLTTRYASRLNVLFGFLRILFLFILGACFGFVKAIAYGQMDSSTLTLLSSAIQSALGAMLMELCTSCLGVSDRFCWFLLWILIAATVCTREAVYHNRRPRRPSVRRGRSSRSLR